MAQSSKMLKQKILHLMEDKIRKTLEDTSVGKNFLNSTSFAQKIVPRFNKWDHMKFKSFCIAKETDNRMEIQHIEWGEIASYSLGKH